MGDAAGEADEVPVSRVKIDKPFYMGVVEITNAQYAAFDAKHDSGVISMTSKDQDRAGLCREPAEPARGPRHLERGHGVLQVALAEDGQEVHAADRGPMGMGLPRRHRFALLLRQSRHRFLASLPTWPTPRLPGFGAAIRPHGIPRTAASTTAPW